MYRFFLSLVSLIAALIASQAFALCEPFLGPCADEAPYCNDGTDCSLSGGIADVQDVTNDVVTDKGFFEYAQDVVEYLLVFLGIVGVLYIIYAGFRILTGAGEEEAVTDAKKTILYVVIGYTVIFLAYSIVAFIIGDEDGPGILDGTSYHFIDRAHAFERGETGTFAEYEERIKAVASTIFNGSTATTGVIPVTKLREMQTLVTEAMNTLPDNESLTNNALWQALLTSINFSISNPGSSAGLTSLQKSLSDFFQKRRVGRITARIQATPEKGNAPLITSLSAMEARDPSGVRIPNENFIWYVKTPTGRKELGRGPNISTTLTEEKRQAMFLEILSASKNSKNRTDVLPFEGSTEIDVLPRVVNFFFTVNGTNVTNLSTYKVSPEVARAGLIIDATASQPAGGSQFVRTQWRFGNGNELELVGGPRLERQIYANQGVYQLNLRIFTNKGDVFSKDLQIIVQSPAAVIVAEKTTGFTREQFTFSPQNTYGFLNPAYRWDIVYLGTPGRPLSEIVYTSQQSALNYKFPKTGSYSVKLTTQLPNGSSDTDSKLVEIEARDPIATFTLRPASNETPNVYRFDASQSYDMDTFSSDNLKFAWTIDGSVVTLSDSSRAGAIGTYKFDTIGEHYVTLDVTNSAGKTASIKQNLTINSLLSVGLTASPLVSRVGETISFSATAPSADSFEWNFGDGSSSEVTENGSLRHTFKLAGIYNVSVTARSSDTSVTPERGQNTAVRRVYIANANAPMAVVGIRSSTEMLLPKADICGGKEAFVVSRAGPTTFTADQSINVDGSKSGLTYRWTYLGRTSNQATFSYQFDELGCFPIILEVISDKNGSRHQSQVFVQVENLLPTLSAISITETSKPNADPIIVTVSASNAQDPDGAVISYLWYYQTDTDPEPQDFRITRSSQTTFVLPRITGKYTFFVTMEDSSGAKVSSVDVLPENSASMTIVAENDVNTPIIDLKMPRSALAVGEEAAFAVTARNIAGMDLSAKSGIEYKWDFDGDGFYDETSDKGQIRHKYEIPGDFNMKVKVTYKGVSNTKFQRVVVKNDLKPDFDIIAIGSKFVLVNTTIGSITEAKWTLDGAEAIGTSRDSFIYDATAGSVPTAATLEVFDGRERKSVKKPLSANPSVLRRIERSEKTIQTFSVPVMEANDTIVIPNARTPITLYLGASKGAIGGYAIDTDTSIDTDLNGTPDDDSDNAGSDSSTSGAPFTFLPPDTWREKGMIRIIALDGEKKVIDSQTLTVTITNVDPSRLATTGTGETETGALMEGISDTDRVRIEEIKDLVRSAGEEHRLKLMQYVSALQESWGDPREKTQIIIDFQTFLDSLPIEAAVRDQLIVKLDNLLYEQDQAKDTTTLAVNVVKNLVPPTSPARPTVDANLAEILSHPTNSALNKPLADAIWQAVKADENISQKDKESIGYQLQVIAGGNAAPVTDPGNTESVKEGMGTVLKVIGGIIGLLILLAIVGYVVSSIRKKKADQTGFQDYLIDTLSGDKKADTFTPDAPKVTPAKAPTISTPAPSSVTSPRERDVQEVKAEKVFAPAPESTPSEVPAWLKATTAPAASPAPAVKEAVIPDSPKESAPAWLTEASVSPAPKKEAPKSESTADIMADLKSPTPAASWAPLSTSDAAPAWLKGMDQDALKKETDETLKSASSQSSTPPTPPTAWLPDWLKA